MTVRTEHTAAELAAFEANEHRKAAESVAGWHFVLMKQKRMPPETHARWASLMIGRAVLTLEDCTAEELQDLCAILRQADPSN